MNVIRIREPNALRPLHVVMLCLVGITVGGGSLLLSAAESTRLVDGAVEWRVDSPLRAVVQLLCLNYRFPTIHAGAIKIYILGVGAGLAVLSLGVAIALGGRTGEEDEPSDDIAVTSTEDDVPGPRPTTGYVAPLVAAQAMVGLYLIWSFVSSRWSAAPALAVGSSVLLTTQFLWALGIGNGLSPAAARVATRMIIAVTVLTSLVAIWYYYGRNPTLRAKFPFGNPIFLSACLIPGVILAATWALGHIADAIKFGRRRSIVTIVLALGALVVALWAFRLAGSRGPAVGLVAGLWAVVIFRLRGRVRWIPIVLALAAALYGVVYVQAARHRPSATGRDATIRLRLYAWDYAGQMIREKPITGHGQGGFTLAGDSYVKPDDVLADSQALGTRIAHTHNEWLEVVADLGLVGITLLAGALLLTLRAGMRAIRIAAEPGHRWVLAGLMGALVGLCVEEAAGVGLRVSGVPTLFYTVIGLIWAMSGHDTPALIASFSKTATRRVLSVGAGCALGLTALIVTQQDFAAARDGYRAEAAIVEGRHDDAITHAERAVSRLNPQRALTNLFRLAEAHTLVARRLQELADDRQARAHAADLPDAKMHLLALARKDRIQSETHCQEGSRALKELVSRSPGFFNRGWVAYWLGRTRALNARAEGDPQQGVQFAKEAAAALRRELDRQPFNAALTVEYVELRLGLGPSQLDLGEMIGLLARPLRHQRITGRFADVLARYMAVPAFEAELDAIVHRVLQTLTALHAAEPPASATSAWQPEILRLGAALRFLRGDYDGARALLEPAAAAYASLAPSTPMGVAGCYTELADCAFFGNPHDAAIAIAMAQQAISLTPESRLGRDLRTAIQQRLIDYHLAAEDEAAARGLIEALAPDGLPAEAMTIELGARYSVLCQSLLHRRQTLTMRKPPGDLLPKLDRWIRRAVTLDPDDAQAHFVMADLAFYAGDCKGAAMHLRHALQLGLDREVASQFILIARGMRPDCEALAEIYRLLHPDDPLPPPAPSAPPSTAPEPSAVEVD